MLGRRQKYRYAAVLRNQEATPCEPRGAVVILHTRNTFQHNEIHYALRDDGLRWLQANLV